MITLLVVSDSTDAERNLMMLSLFWQNKLLPSLKNQQHKHQHHIQRLKWRNRTLCVLKKQRRIFYHQRVSFRCFLCIYLPSIELEQSIVSFSNTTQKKGKTTKFITCLSKQREATKTRQSRETRFLRFVAFRCDVGCWLHLLNVSVLNRSSHTSIPFMHNTRCTRTSQQEEILVLVARSHNPYASASFLSTGWIYRGIEIAVTHAMFSAIFLS